MAKLTALHGGRIYDPANGVNGEVRSIYLGPNGIVPAPADPGEIGASHDISGCVVMAGGIDIHTHIGGGKVNLARMMLPEDHARDAVARGVHPRMGCGHAAPSTFTVGYRYAEMGYTACFEPAMLLSNARQADRRQRRLRAAG